MNSNFLIFNLSSCFIFVWIRGACPTDGDRARALKRTHVPSQSRKCPKCNCIFPFKCKTPPPLFWNIFFVPLLALLALPWQLCLNIINIFKMPEKKKVGGVENTRKIVEKKNNPNFFHRGLFGSTFISKLKESIYKACLCSKWVGRFLNVKVRYWTWYAVERN